MDHYNKNEKMTNELRDTVEAHSNDYQPEAIEEAKEELRNRGQSFNEESQSDDPISYAEKHYNTNLRFWDYLIDLFVAGVILGIVFIVVGMPEDELEQNFLSIVVGFLYYFLMEGLLGKTVGKLILGLRVVDINGNKPTWGALALRTACRFIPLEGLSFIFESGWRHHTLIGNLHDKVSKTYVVKDVR